LKLSKIIGLTAIAVLALMATLGAGTAAAKTTTLCKTNTNSPACYPGDRYAASTALKATSSKVVLEGVYGGKKIECTESALEGKSGAETGSPMPLTISKWTLNGCSSSQYGKCITSSLNENFTGSLAWTEGSNGSLSVGKSKGENVNPAWGLLCGSKICTFVAEAVPLPVSGGNPAQIVASKMGLIDQAGCLTPFGSANITATYALNSPSPAYVTVPTSGGPWKAVSLCKENWDACAVDDRYPAGTTLTGEAKEITFATNWGATKITCKKASFSAKTTADWGVEFVPAEVLSFPLEECKQSSIGSCTVTTSKLGTMELYDGGVNAATVQGDFVSWRFQCGGLFDCTFRSIFPSQMKGGNPATWTLTNNKVLYEGSVCPTEPPFMTAGFFISSPTPLHISS